MSAFRRVGSGDRPGQDQQLRFTDPLTSLTRQPSDIRDAESILIFGPGEAKGELKRVGRVKLGARTVAVETLHE